MFLGLLAAWFYFLHVSRQARFVQLNPTFCTFRVKRKSCNFIQYFPSPQSTAKNCPRRHHSHIPHKPALPGAVYEPLCLRQAKKAVTARQKKRKKKKDRKEDKIKNIFFFSLSEEDTRIRYKQFQTGIIKTYSDWRLHFMIQGMPTVTYRQGLFWFKGNILLRKLNLHGIMVDDFQEAWAKHCKLP